MSDVARSHVCHDHYGWFKLKTEITSNFIDSNQFHSVSERVGWNEIPIEIYIFTLISVGDFIERYMNATSM